METGIVTSIYVDSDILKSARLLAQVRNVSLSALVTDLLRLAIAAHVEQQDEADAGRQAEE